jgi:MYXO-CTERM domain-containing protein
MSRHRRDPGDDGCACQLARPSGRADWMAAAAFGLLFAALFLRRRQS